MTPTHSEAELVHMLRNRDEARWNDFITDHEEFVAKAICRTGGFFAGQEAEVQDLRQEAFLAAIKGIDSFDGSGSLRGWLYRIAVNKTISWIRRKRRNPVDSIEEQDASGDLRRDKQLGSASSADPRNAVALKEDVARLEECLEKLRGKNDQWWEIVVRRGYEEANYEEIAQDMSISLGLVSSGLRRGRLWLHNCVYGNKTPLPSD